MCNLYRLENAHDATARLARELGRQLSFPEGIPNFEPRAEIRITDRAPIVRIGASEDAELVQRRWSWPGPGGKPVYNFRSEGREFRSGRCVILADGFYEFTAPADPKAKRKERWLFTWPGHDWFGIAGIVRHDPGVGEAFTMLTCPPGPDIAPYHDRQVVLLSPRDCFGWLDPASAAQDFLQPLPEGSLAVAAA